VNQLLSTTGLTKRFGGLTAVNEVDYLITEGQAAGVIGPNGSGKTTLFNLLSGYFPPSAGRITFLGREITEMLPHQRVALGIARTFQLVSVFSHLSVWENLVLPFVCFDGKRRSARRFYMQSQREKSLATDCFQALETVGLAAKAESPTVELSYGDKRMLEIAMALALKPKLLLLDEPLAGLSDHEIAQVFEMIASLKEQFTLVMIEHKISKIVGLIEHLCVMNEGSLICSGEPETVLADPKVRECYWGVEEQC
jgi:branched-chain amino acid transport system ATP-binding protein